MPPQSDCGTPESGAAASPIAMSVMTLPWLLDGTSRATPCQSGDSVGCGLGSSSVLLAQAYPAATVVGSDYHAESIELARKKATEAGVADRVSFEVATAQSFTGTGFDLVTMFDCLHDMGDPLGAARKVRDALAPDGTWLLVEPFAADRVEDNFNPVGRLYYSPSTFLCVPNGLSQPGGSPLGAQAGEAAIRALTAEAGFTRFRRVAQTPFNLVFEIRPKPTSTRAGTHAATTAAAGTTSWSSPVAGGLVSVCGRWPGDAVPLR